MTPGKSGRPRVEIVPSIHWVQGVNANCYVLVGEELTLIDTGMAKKPQKIQAYITGELHRSLSDVKTIILTHAHSDHTGGLAELKRMTGAKAAIHSAEADYLAGIKKLPIPKGVVGVLFKTLGPLITAERVKPDIILNDGDIISGLKVIHIPGHTPGSIALLDSARKVLFTGDTLRYRNGMVEGPVERFTPDMTMALKSVEKLKALEFDVMLCGHGTPLKGNAGEMVRNLKI
jgi:glyoxylase-like metal-dependent hydrolase (beta-lactamase superfamily II)